MTLTEFETELRKLHPDFAVIKINPSVQTASVLFKGVYQFAIGGNGIYKDPNPEYALEHPSGKLIRHRTIGEATAMAKKIISEMKKGSENYRAQQGLGEFSDHEMNKDVHPYSSNLIS